MRRITHILFTASVLCLSLTAAHSEEGCPANQFPSDRSNHCVSVSEYDRVVANDEPMTFTARQDSLTISWVAAEGVITEDTPAKFAKYLASHDRKVTSTIELHSPGGKLAAGLALGRMIRAAGYSTRVKRTISLSDYITNVYHYKSAVCLSACAYAFLGGIDRSFDKNDLYGLHRFGLTAGKIDSDAAQVVTSEIAKYLAVC
jgi:hypothetical protein